MARNLNIKGFIPSSMLDWPGKMASVLFLGGCGFRCPACHNYNLVLEPASIPDFPVDEILRYLEHRDTWIDGVVITGGEPTIGKNLPELLVLFKERGLKVKLETNGSNPHILEKLLEDCLIDGVSMDVKAPLTEPEYSRIAGVRVDPAVIERSINILKASCLEVLFRTTVIPGLVEEPQLERIRESLGDVSWFRIQPFRNIDTLDPAFGLIEPFKPSRIEDMRMRFEIPRPVVGMGRWYASAG